MMTIEQLNLQIDRLEADHCRAVRLSERGCHWRAIGLELRVVARAFALRMYCHLHCLIGR